MKKLFIFILVFFTNASISVSQDLLWQATYGEGDSETAYSVQETADRGFILAGETWSSTEGMNDCYVVKTDSTGEMIWSRKYGGSERERAYTVHQTADGGFFIGGYNETNASGYLDCWLLRINAHGDTLWTRTYGTIRPGIYTRYRMVITSLEGIPSLLVQGMMIFISSNYRASIPRRFQSI